MDFRGFGGQEMDVMNTLLAEIVRSLKELQLGFAGELTMSDAMEGLMDALYLDKVRAMGTCCSYGTVRCVTRPNGLGTFVKAVQGCLHARPICRQAL